MATDITPPDPSPVLDLLYAFRMSKAMFTAVSLGVFDALASGPKTAAALAGELKADSGALEQLLDTCVALKLLTREEELRPSSFELRPKVEARNSKVGADPCYANSSAAAAYLCKASPRRMTGYVYYSNEFLWKLWGNLEDAVREGTNRWKQAYGWDGPIFSSLFRSEEAKREFLMGMHGYGQISSPKVVNVFDLSPFRRLVDLGGATGHLAIAACMRYPDLRAVVFDLPAAVPLAREIIGMSPVADRIEIVAGDFFTDELPKGDLYSLGRILHDWTEAKIRKLLGKVFARMPPDGALLIAEKLLDEDKTGPLPALLQSLNMLTCTEGKERTLSEYEAILKSVGFAEVEGCRTNASVDAMLAWKR
jgi:acetylserotonin O-methyltransferase